MTTAGNFRGTTTWVVRDVQVAGVPWPAYKVIALIVGALVAVVVGLATMSAAPAVLGGAAAGAVAWIALGAYRLTAR